MVWYSDGGLLGGRFGGFGGFGKFRTHCQGELVVVRVGRMMMMMFLLLVVRSRVQGRYVWVVDGIWGASIGKRVIQWEGGGVFVASKGRLRSFVVLSLSFGFFVRFR